MSDAVATTGVETESTTTVLTEDTNLDTGAVAPVDGAAAKPVDQDGGDAGAEGSLTPPDAYADFVMPEGVQLDAAALAEATPLFKELGLTQEQSQKVIDLYAKQTQAGSQKHIDNFNQLMNDWRGQAKIDSEFGGDKFNENVKVAQSAINTYGTPELKQLLEEQGVGNHPEVIRFMVRVGRTLKEDVPGSAGASSNPAADRVSILYPQK